MCHQLFEYNTAVSSPIVWIILISTNNSWKENSFGTESKLPSNQIKAGNCSHVSDTFNCCFAGGSIVMGDSMLARYMPNHGSILERMSTRNETAQENII